MSKARTRRNSTPVGQGNGCNILAGVLVKARNIHLWVAAGFLTGTLLLAGCGSSGGSQGGGGNQNVSVTVTPSASNATVNATAQFSATVSGTSNSGVTWTVVEGSDGGSVSTAGLYTASATPGVYHVRATSVADKDATAAGQITVVNAASSIKAQLNAVWGSGSGDVWAVGGGFNYHWDGTSWTPTAIQSKYGNYVVNTYAVWGSSSTDVWEAGISTALELKHWDGSTWTDYPPNDVSYVNGLWGSSSNNIWGVGAAPGSAAYHWDGTAWTFQAIDTSPNDTGNVFAVWGSGANDVWAVGAVSTSSGPTVASTYHWNGTTWASVPSNLQEPLNGIWGSSSTDVWAVGDGGLIAHWDGSSWTLYSSGTTQTLAAVWGSGANDVWAVGIGGTVVHWNGTSWTQVPVSTTNTLLGVWGSGPGDVWAVGDGVILHLPL